MFIEHSTEFNALFKLFISIMINEWVRVLNWRCIKYVMTVTREWAVTVN